MCSKRFLIRALVLLNIALGVILVASATDGTRAFAQQAGGGSGVYATGTGFYEATTEAVWLLNATEHELAVLLPDQQSGAMQFLGKRDVREDAQ